MMNGKTIFFLGLLLSIFLQKSWGQEPMVLFEQAIREQQKVYQVDKSKRVLQLPMQYGEFIPFDGLDQQLQVTDVDSIHLAYTNHPQGLDFDQLNQDRFRTLAQVFPELMKQNVQFPVKIIEQIGVESKEQASALYHGFSIYINPSSNKYLQLDPEKILQRQMQIKKQFNALIKRKMGLHLDDDQSTVMAFKRNHQQWDNVVIVSDWTGSMYKYTLQVLLWQIQEQSMKQLMGFTFFNDGGFKSNADKQIGQTGGIYHVYSRKPTDIIRQMAVIKQSGDGGDIPENDVEALIEAQKAYKDVHTLVLIADNRSQIRDIELLEEVKKPVRVVLSNVRREGEQYIFNEQYVRLALTTQGSIHTSDMDINDPETLRSLLTE
ncbi:hypothetical protein [Algivirga pacifica]|uniref:VWFA domain-containing protein n=1 Tax=Algivirga pacifica TaxID=1162670 RepID=A0ABP9DHT5_9BACT